MSDKKIRVLVVDDSPLFREAIVGVLLEDSRIEVVETACDADDAWEKIKVLDPDVVTLDIGLPGKNGIEFLYEIIPQRPIRVVIVSAISSCVFEAMKAGAIDFATKPDDKLDLNYSRFAKDLINKVKIAAEANLSCIKSIRPDKPNIKKPKIDIIAIGASTGGPEALSSVLTCLPVIMPGIVVVQHMPATFTKFFSERLDRACQLEVLEAKDGDEVLHGRVLIAPGGYQMRVNVSAKGYFVECLKGERVNRHCPSVDFLFQSVAEKAGEKALGVILTGMGADGSLGLFEMRKKGARTIGQDAATSVVYGMPKVAYELGAVEAQVGIKEISELILKVLSEE